MATGPERRQAVRGGGALLAFVKVARTGKVERVLTKNLSAGGMCFVSDIPRQAKDTVEVEVQLPDFAKTVVFQAVVMWSRLIPSTDKSVRVSRFEIGVRITNIDPKSQALLNQYATMNPLPP